MALNFGRLDILYWVVFAERGCPMSGGKFSGFPGHCLLDANSALSPNQASQNASNSVRSPMEGRCW